MYGCDTFGPKHIWSLDIWSPTIGPQLIGPSGQMVPNQFCPHGQMVPKNLVPLDKWSPTKLVPLEKWSLEYSICLGVQAVMIWKYGDQIGWGPFVTGTKFDGDRLSRGTKLLGTICPWGLNFRGPFVHGDRKWGTGSPGIKWVQDQMIRSPTNTLKSGAGEKFYCFPFSKICSAESAKSAEQTLHHQREYKIEGTPILKLAIVKR
jgi:hypothetical protein